MNTIMEETAELQKMQMDKNKAVIKDKLTTGLRVLNPDFMNYMNYLLEDNTYVGCFTYTGATKCLTEFVVIRVNLSRVHLNNITVGFQLTQVKTLFC